MAYRPSAGSGAPVNTGSGCPAFIAEASVSRTAAYSFDECSMKRTKSTVPPGPVGTGCDSMGGSMRMPATVSTAAPWC